MNCPAPLVCLVRFSPLPCRLTVTPESPTPSTLTCPATPEARRYVPSKLTTFVWPTSTADVEVVAPKAMSSSSKPEISMV